MKSAGNSLPGNAPGPTPQDVTRLLVESAEGSESARDVLMDMVYGELHTMARSRMRGERMDHTLSATALVSETYLKLFQASTEGGIDHFNWSSRAGFFTAAATTMRRILVDHARAKATNKRGGTRRSRGDRVALDVLEAAHSLEPEDFLALDEAISRLESIDERAATVVRLRFYGGLEQSQVATIVKVSERTVKRDWEFARAWLREALGEMDTPNDEESHPTDPNRD